MPLPQLSVACTLAHNSCVRQRKAHTLRQRHRHWWWWCSKRTPFTLGSIRSQFWWPNSCLSPNILASHLRTPRPELLFGTLCCHIGQETDANSKARWETRRRLYKRRWDIRGESSTDISVSPSCSQLSCQRSSLPALWVQPREWWHFK